MVNTSKNNAMIFGDITNSNFSIVLNENSIEFIDKINCLGLFIDSKLLIPSKVCFTLKELYSLESLLPCHAYGLIMPIITYDLDLFCGTLGYVIKKIKPVFNRVVRYIYFGFIYC